MYTYIKTWISQRYLLEKLWGMIDGTHLMVNGKYHIYVWLMLNHVVPEKLASEFYIYIYMLWSRLTGWGLDRKYSWIFQNLRREYVKSWDLMGKCHGNVQYNIWSVGMYVSSIPKKTIIDCHKPSLKSDSVYGRYNPFRWGFNITKWIKMVCISIHGYTRLYIFIL